MSACRRTPAKAVVLRPSCQRCYRENARGALLTPTFSSACRRPCPHRCQSRRQRQEGTECRQRGKSLLFVDLAQTPLPSSVSQMYLRFPIATSAPAEKEKACVESSRLWQLASRPCAMAMQVSARPSSIEAASGDKLKIGDRVIRGQRAARGRTCASLGDWQAAPLPEGEGLRLWSTNEHRRSQQG